MKRVAVIFLLIGCAGAALWAQSPIGLSAGAGGNFTTQFTSYFLTSDAKDKKVDTKDINGSFIGGGGYAFFDATYAEGDVGVLIGKPKYGDTDSKTSITSLKLGLFGKFPFDMGGFSFFPMAGIDGQIFLAGSTDGEKWEDPSDEIKKRFNLFWFKAGIGADIPVADRVYIRPQFLYGIRLPTENETDATKDIKVGDQTVKSNYSAVIGHGLDIRLAVGFKF
jgi:hypothetical protein